MKTTMRRLLALLLVFGLILGISPVWTVSAAGENQPSSKLTGSGFYVAPVYRDTITAEILPQRPSILSNSSSDPVRCTTLEEAGKYLRECLVAREIPEDFILIQYPADAAPTTEEQVLAEAYKHTGVPTEGDYLKYQCAVGFNHSAYGQDTLFIFGPEYYSSAEQEAELQPAIDELVAQIKASCTTEYEKIKAVYDYICEFVYYDNVNVDKNDYYLQYTAYAAMVQKTAVCQGYANLFYRLCLELGIDARVIGGNGINSKGEEEAHAWNIVQLDGQWYNVDATWDAQQGVYSYFLRSDADFPDHERDAEYNTQEFLAAYPIASESYVPTDGVKPGLYRGSCGTNVFWKLDHKTGTLTISGTGAMTDYRIASENPNTITWTQRPWEGLTFQSVMIEDGVTHIGSCAFANLPMENVTVGRDVTSIGDYAFLSCEQLKQVSFTGNAPATVGEDIFNGVTATVSLPAENTTWTEEAKQSLGGYGLTFVAASDPKVYGTSMILGSDLSMLFYVNAQDFPKLDQTDAPWSIKVSKGSDTQVFPFSQWQQTEDGKLYYVTYQHMTAKEMTEPVTVEIYYDNVLRCEAPFVETIRDYALRTFDLPETTDDLKHVLVDMLNYGTEAQKYFGYQTDNLANAKLTAEQQKFASADLTAAPPNGSYYDENYYGSNLELRNKISLIFYFTNIDSEINSIKEAEVTFRHHHGEEETIIIPANQFVSYGSDVKGVRVDALSVADYQETVTVRIKGLNGGLAAIARNNIESYLSGVQEQDGDKPIYRSILKFCSSAKHYFENR